MNGNIAGIKPIRACLGKLSEAAQVLAQARENFVGATNVLPDGLASDDYLDLLSELADVDDQIVATQRRVDKLLDSLIDRTIAMKERAKWGKLNPEL